MRLFILIGPDTLALEYKSKAAARKAIREAKSKATYPRSITNHRGHLACRFLTRRYTESELAEALVFTPLEYWKALK